MAAVETLGGGAGRRARQAVLALVLGVAVSIAGGAAAADGAHDFAFESIDGGPLPMASFAGHPVLLVNTASFCGFTPQYEGLEALWQRYRDRGLVVLGVPSNDFGGQEPGSDAEIKEFCRSTYLVDFPMTAKEKVIGADAHPLYRWIADSFGDAATPRWNFHKYLFAKDGSLKEVWSSRVTPLSAEVLAAVERELAP